MTAFEFSMGALSIDRVIVEKLGWTLVHFLWQGAIVAAALAVLDTLLGHHRPQHRYVAACGALLVMLVLPIATWLGTSTPRIEPRGIVTLRSGDPASLSARRPGLRNPGRTFRSAIAPNRTVRVSPASRTAVDLQALRLRVAGVLLPWFVAFWAAGVALLSLRLLGGWWLVKRLGSSARNVPIAEWQATVTELAGRLGVSRPVRLVRSGLVQVPTALGWLRPVILLPASTLTGLSGTQITAILAHELAHIRRHDYLVNLLQSVIETLLFYHPAVWWVSRRIRDERELCCDDLAVRASGDAITYARALCELERLRGQGPALAVAATGGSLVARIARLLGASQSSHVDTVRGLAWALIALLALVGGAAGGAVRVTDRAASAPRSRSQSVPRLIPAGARALPVAAPKSPAVTAVASPAAFTAVPAVAVPAVTATLPPDAVIACDQPTDEDEDAPSPRTPSLMPSRPARPMAPSWKLLDVSNASVTPFSGEDWERLAQSGVSAKYVSELNRFGYRDLSVDELISLAQHGVSPALAGGARETLGDVSADDLVRLANHGISPAYIKTMRRSVGDASVEDLVRLASAGVSPDYVAGMRELALDDLSAEDLIRLANSGVSLEWFAAMRWLGYSDFTVERAIQLRNAGVTPDYAASLTVLSHKRITLDELRRLITQGVDVEYAATLLNLLRTDLTVDELIRLRQQGVDIEFVAAMNALGYEKLSSEDLIQLRQQGISPEYVAAMDRIGCGRLSTRDLIRLAQNGVTPDFVQDVRDAGYEVRDVSSLIRMRQTGIPQTGLPKDEK